MTTTSTCTHGILHCPSLSRSILISGLVLLALWTKHGSLDFTTGLGLSTVHMGRTEWRSGALDLALDLFIFHAPRGSEMMFPTYLFSRGIWMLAGVIMRMLIDMGDERSKRCKYCCTRNSRITHWILNFPFYACLVTNVLFLL